MKIKVRQEHILLFFILLLGFLLRTHNLKDIPFTHDELSVVFRTEYSSFKELISEGIKPDVHPAGVQVFMYCWVAVFGDTEAAVKFPFILAGILSIFLVFRLGREWFGIDAGLVSAAFIATLEYMVMHSQTARPYASGLLLSLLMVYAWQRYLFRPGKRPYLWLVAYVIFAALCAYNHYFSLMFAAITGATGILFINRRKIIPYLLACLSVFILFIPHLKIFFYQFREKGVEGWLAKPDNDFILDYVGYIFHFSPYVFAIILFIVAAGILSGQTRKLLSNRFFYISLAWFFIPFLIAFFYSRYVSAVLQFRVMIFFFPFLLFLFTGNLPDLKKTLRLILPLAICIIVSISLVLERRYYELYYHSRFKEIILETNHSIKNLGPDNCLVFIDSHEKISEYYYERLGIRFEHYRVDELSGKTEFIRLLETSDKDYLSLGVDSQTDLALPGIILDYFPYLLKKIDYQGGNYYLFAREDPAPDPYQYISLNDFSQTAEYWSAGVDSLLTDSIGCSDNTSYCFDKQHEFGPTFSIPLAKITNHKNDLIDISVSVRNLDSLNNALLVFSLNGKKELVEWTSAPFPDYDPQTGEWYTVYHTFRPGKYFGNSNFELKIYVWNRERNEFLIDDFRVRARTGNRILYGLRQKI